MRITILGATGRAGRHLVEQALAAGHQVAAIDGVSKLFLMRPPQISDVRSYLFPVVDYAKGAGVEQIVFLSLLGVERQRFVTHYKVKKYLKASGVPHTFLRPSFYMQNLNTTHRDEIRELEEILIPVGRAQTSFVDVRDIGAVAAKVLTEPGHENRAYEPTGGAALDYYQVAELFTEVLGRKITYRKPSILRFIGYQRQKGTPLTFVLVMAGLYTATRFGSGKWVTQDVEQLLVRPPIAMRQYIEDFANFWLPEVGKGSSDDEW